jgi:2,3-bisphosphoglycerate-dependent phosphoglycerate mutase
MTQLYLIRHGEAYCNLERDGSGTVPGILGDKGLTPRGRAQAQRLRERLETSGEIKADALLASTFARAWQTAEIIAPALGLSIIPDDDLQEMRVGEADGLTERELFELHAFPDYRANPYARLAPGAENWGEFTLRVGAMFDRVIHEYAGKSVVLVTHGGVVDSSFNVFMRLHTLRVPEFALYTHNTAITAWELDDSGGFHGKAGNDGTSYWRLVRYNDDYHLRFPPEAASEATQGLSLPEGEEL